MNYTLSRNEQETIILIYPTQELADIGTSDPVYIRKLDKLCQQYPEIYKLVRENQYGEKSYTVPKKMLAFKNPPSAAQIEASRNALKRANGNQG